MGDKDGVGMRTAVKRMVFALLLVGLTVCAHADSSYSWTGTQEIPDDDASGVAYSFNLSDEATTITSVSVTLSVSSGWNGDLYAYLSYGDGFAVLLNRVGVTAGNEEGYANPGFNVTLSSSGTADIHNYQTLSPTYNANGQLEGTWAADGRYLNPASSGSDFYAASRDNTLSVFNGLDPNGTWTLFIADVNGGSISTIDGWSVNVTAVPEPGSLALLFTGALTLLIVARRRANRRQ
jgi:subtilisin-like proprotein convertase family protein